MTEVWCVGMVRDEADVIEYTLRHLIASGVTGIIIADNQSTDGTVDIIMKVRAGTNIPIVICNDAEPGYYQSAKMTKLAELACHRSATPWPWIIPFDADEILVCDSNVQFAKYLRSMPESVRAFSVPMFNYFPCYLDEANENPFKRISHRHLPINTLPKVVFRGTHGITIEQGSHSILDTDGTTLQAIASTMLNICHFPYRSAAHFVRKSINGGRAYKAAVGIPDYQGEHWRGYYAAYERGGEAALVSWFENYFYFGPARMHEMVLDPAPILG